MPIQEKITIFQLNELVGTSKKDIVIMKILFLVAPRFAYGLHLLSVRLRTLCQFVIPLYTCLPFFPPCQQSYHNGNYSTFSGGTVKLHQPQ